MTFSINNNNNDAGVIIINNNYKTEIIIQLLTLIITKISFLKRQGEQLAARLMKSPMVMLEVSNRSSVVLILISLQ